MENDKHKERERMWNKPQLRRSSSSLSFNSPGERSRTHSTPSHPNFDRPTSWHSSVPIEDSDRIGSPSRHFGPVDKEERIGQERERNWNSPHPKWEIQKPRAMSPLPPSPPVSGTGYGKPPPDWDPNRDYDSPSRSRHSSFNGGRRVSYERSRTSSLTDEFPPPKPQPSLTRAATDDQIGRPHSPAPSDAGDEHKGREYNARFGWSFLKKRINLPPFELDSEPPHKRPATPPDPRPSGHLSTRQSLIPIRSPSRRDDEGSSTTQPRGEEGVEHRRGHQRNPATFTDPISFGARRARIEPEDLMSVEVEDLVPTDIESGMYTTLSSYHC